MTRPVRVLIVAPPPDRPGLRDELEESGLHVAGEVTMPSAIAEEDAIDVIVLGDGGLLDAIGSSREPAAVALVVLTRDEGIASELAARDLRGWAVVSPESASADLAAAVVAAARGFAVHPVSADHPEGDADDEGEDAPLEALTTREREVLELVSEGLPNKAIASRLGISDHTVKFHLSSIFSKLGVSTRTEAVRRAVRAGLITF